MDNNKSDLNQKHFTSSPASGLAYDCNQLQQWLLYTPLGREILRKERIFLRHNVEHIFGAYSLQIGLSDINFLHGNKIPNHYTVNVDLKTDLRFLPFANNSIDLIVSPHVLEFTDNYHHVLQEFSRILTPHGKLIISCFNRYSWFGLFKNKVPLLHKANLISLQKLKDQLQALNFQLDGGKFFSYCPPASKTSTLAKFKWLNKVGDRWFPTLANSFAIIVSKEIITPTIIKPKISPIFQSLTPALGAVSTCNQN